MRNLSRNLDRDDESLTEALGGITLLLPKNPKPTPHGRGRQRSGLCPLTLPFFCNPSISGLVVSAALLLLVVVGLRVAFAAALAGTFGLVWIFWQKQGYTSEGFGEAFVEQDVGRLLLAGFVPGIFSAIVYAGLVILLAVGIRGFGTSGRRIFVARAVAFFASDLAIFLVVLVIVGFVVNPFGGDAWGTPTEGGALGAFCCLFV